MDLICRINSIGQRLLKVFSRSEWLLRLLHQPKCEGTADAKGLVLIQIDGLSQTQFQRAIAEGRMPFLRKLLSKRGYQTHTFYSGLPSSTPAVQAELFYGVKTAVPAFEFIERRTGRRHAMFLPASANVVVKRLRQQGNGLLQGGTAYSNVYSGGAEKARYCAETMDLQSLLQSVNPLKQLFISILYFGKLACLLGYAALELGLAGYDFFRGVWSGKSVLKELKFIPTRLFICIILRELIRLRIKLDVTRGIPVVSANLLGYDEQAHRRGPASGFAHWTLKGIDEVIRDICKTAFRSECRDYRVVIFSDHGQESVETYDAHMGKPVKQVIRELFDQNRHRSINANRDNGLAYFHRRTANLFLGKGRMSRRFTNFNADSLPDHMEITTMGPVGHIYLPGPRRNRQAKSQGSLQPDNYRQTIESFASGLARDAQIPMVLYRKGTRVLGVRGSKSFDIEVKPELALGPDHPFLNRAIQDLKALCQHPDAGDLIISGWNFAGTPWSFNIESGAHGGPGREETRGFVLLPPGMKHSAAVMRPLDLRNRLLAYLDNSTALYQSSAHSLEESSTDSSPGNKTNVRASIQNQIAAKPFECHPSRLKVITYNIHSCINMDGRVNPDRTADVIAAFDPDIVAIQEVDVGCRRTHFLDQGTHLANCLGMICRFFPVLENGSSQYGLAIMSRLPILSSRFGRFPNDPNSPDLESRGVMSAEVETAWGTIQLLNTHLGLEIRERRRQVSTLLGPEWIAGATKNDRLLIVCGDFNAGPRSYAYRQMSRRVHDVQTLITQKKYPKATFYSRFPVLRLDHIFVSKHFRCHRVVVPNDYETRLVSDHLPVFCELGAL